MYNIVRHLEGGAINEAEYFREKLPKKNLDVFRSGCGNANWNFDSIRHYAGSNFQGTCNIGIWNYYFLHLWCSRRKNKKDNLGMGRSMRKTTYSFSYTNKNLDLLKTKDYYNI